MIKQITSSNVIIPKDYKIITKKEINTKNIKNLILQEGLECIGNSTFSLQKISKLTTPATLKRIGSYAFISNPLEILELNEGLEWIGESAFEECNLKEVTIPRSVFHIGTNAFYNNPIEKVIVDVYSLYALGYDEELYDIFGKKVLVERKDLHQIDIKRKTLK